MKPTTTNQNGPITLNNPNSLSSFTASEISAAVKFSPALARYLSFSYSPDQSYHQMRNSSWSAAAVATILDSETPEVICATWSEFAQNLLSRVFTECFQSLDGIALFALGKLGAQELNLSSDVDLLIVAREDNGHHSKPLRQFQRTLSEQTLRGFLFRVDFDLRPGGRHGPLITTVDQFTDYYGNYGETWERLALVRLRPLCGDPDLIVDIQNFTQKFTYRKHLDYSLLEDLKVLRGKIHQHQSPEIPSSTWDLKLGIGGIRDVELFVHAMQVIHGGKNPQLQVHSTSLALERLEASGALPSDEAHFLKHHYWQLRRLENFVQAQDDEQNHHLENSDSHPVWVQILIKDLRANLRRCDQVASSLLGNTLPSLPLANQLSSVAQGLWQEILEIEVLSRHKERDEQARLQFLHEFQEILQRQKGDTDQALLHLKDFIKSTRAKASFFTLLVRHKNLMEELAWLFGHSPYLSQILSSRPELMDSYVYRSQDLQSQDIGVLLEQLVEKRLLGELINGSHFLEDKNVGHLQENLSSTADEIVSSLLAELKKDFASDLEILCLGKWGGRELGFRSDLDFIFVTPQEPTENDVKLARRLTNRLSEPRRGGCIYNLDMRLRPSGHSGPFVVSDSQLRSYLANEAQPWERQAYLKARWLQADKPTLQSILTSRALTQTELVELDKIRQDLIRTDSHTLDLKYVEGGLLDIELFAQAEVLAKSLTVQGPSTLDFLRILPSSERLTKNYSYLRQVEQMLQLISTGGGAKLHPNHESFQHLAKALRILPQDLKKELDLRISENLQILNQLDPRRLSKILNFSS